MSAAGTLHIGSLVWKTFPSGVAALMFFGDRLRPEHGGAIARVARGESLLVRLGCPAPLDWAERPMITCEACGDGGVCLLLADLDLAAATYRGMLANIEDTRGRRPEGFEMWRIEKWTPPPSSACVASPRSGSARSIRTGLR